MVGLQEIKFRRRPGFDPRPARVPFSDGEGPESLRSFATTHWGLQQAVTPVMARAARAIQHQVVGRGHHFSEVEGNNVVNYRPDSERSPLHAEAHRACTMNLLRVAGFLAPDAEVGEMVWLACHEVGFHVDDDLAVNDAFLVWHVAGPAKGIEFPNMGFGLVTQPGDAVLFDGLQPHGVRTLAHAKRPFRDSNACDDPPTREADLTVYLSVDVPLTPPLRSRMGICTAPNARERSAPGFMVHNATGRTRLRLRG